MTREIIEKLPENVQDRIAGLKKQFKACTDYHRRYEMRERIAGYVDGLRDAGIVTEVERRIVYIYATL